MARVKTPADSWPEYRKLFEQEMEDSRAFRTEMRESLRELSSVMTQFKSERRVAVWGASTLIAIPVAIATSWLGRKMGM